MNYFQKLFFSILLILTGAVTAVECMAVSNSMEQAFFRERDGALTRHQLVEYTIRASVLSAADSKTITRQDLEVIGEKAEALMAEESAMQLGSVQGECYYTDLPEDAPLPQPEEGSLRWFVWQREDSAFLQTESLFTQSGQTLVLVTLRDISAVFSEAEALKATCRRIYALVLAAGTLAALLLSWAMTRPIRSLQKTSRALAQGDWKARAQVGGRDEMRQLADTYNQMAAAMEETVSQLEESARRQELFTASFAHELKTPMTSIIGYADTLYQKELPPEEQKQAAGYILNEAMRLEALSFKLMDLLNLDRREFLLEQTELSGLLRDAGETLRPAAEKRGIVLKIQAEEGWARAEWDLMKTLLLNLLDNAMKSGTDQITLCGASQAGQYVITVADRGRGIPPEELRRICEPFYMVDKSRSRKEHGAGLGLALCSRIARIHHTALEYESVPGEGTSVTVRLEMEAQHEEEA